MWFSCSQIFLNYLTVNSFEGPGWLNELGSRNTQQLIQAYYQYGFVNCKNGAFDSAPSNEAYQLFAHGRWLLPPIKLVAMILLKMALKNQIKIKSYLGCYVYNMWFSCSQIFLNYLTVKSFDFRRS
jgi:hypothetical protein